MTEETHAADRSGPRGIVMSIFVSLIAGFVLLVGMTAAIQHYSSEALASVPGAQVMLDALGRHWAEFALFIVVGAQFYCGMSSVTANSRMIYAFSRDGAVPGSRIWATINKRTRTPTNSIWLAAVAAFIVALPYLWSPVAYAAVTSIATIGLYIAYAMPVYLRLRRGRDFREGPWSLGRWSRPIGIVAVLWVILICILFILPTVSPPFKLQNINYAIVAVAVVVLYSGGYWLLSARKWFKGPRIQGSEKDLEQIERELGETAGV